MDSMTATALVMTVVGLGALIGAYNTIKKLIADPQARLAEELHRQHEDFRVEITAQGARTEKIAETVERAQAELHDISEKVYENKTRIVILEQKVGDK